MARVFTWLLRIFVVLCAVGIAVLFGMYFFVSRSLIDAEGEWTARGIDAPVEIVRNVSSVPHIFGESDADVYFGLGFAHAQDRLWQMTLMRRTVQGRLSELFGQRTIRTDELMRRLDLYSAARASVSVQDEATIEMLEAYARGVNAWLEQVNEGALGRGAPEFFAFEPEIAAWTAADSIAIVKLMALRLSPHLQEEVLRARVSLLPTVDDDRLKDILPDVPGQGVAALPAYAALAPGIVPSPEPIRLAEDPLHPVQPLALAGASNAWAASPSRAAALGSLVAHDPHLGFSAPSPWYLARLELAAGGVVGATIPGVPVVMAGRSERLGWAITASYMDDQDLFLEELSPVSADEYRTPDGFAPFESRDSIILVAEQDPVTIRLRWTDNGPVLPGHQLNLAPITPPGHVVALSWTALSEEDTSMTAARQLMEAKTVDEAIVAGAGYIAPSLNLVVADAQRIAMKTVGAQPRRDAAHQSQGRLPTLGWMQENRWQGLFGYEANPEFVDPPGGIIGNTNNKTVDRPFPSHVSYEWGDTQRIQRWRRLMQQREVHTRESFIEAQLDTVSFTARSLLPLIGADLWFTGAAAAEGTPEGQRSRALALLSEWNGEMSEHRPEPLLYAAWLRALQDRLIRDELGPLAGAFTHPEPLFIERVYRDIGGAAVWCDVVQSAPIETCTDIARLALDDALLEIGETYGTALESLRWGDVHEAAHDHPVLGEVPIVKWFVNIRQSTSGGDNTLLMGRTRGFGPNPFLNVHGPGYRGVYDFADPESSVFIIATGQSGHPLSRHYDDLGELWRRGEYIPMVLDPELARAGAEGITVILPDGLEE